MIPLCSTNGSKVITISFSDYRPKKSLRSRILAIRFIHNCFRSETLPPVQKRRNGHNEAPRLYLNTLMDRFYISTPVSVHPQLLAFSHFFRRGAVIWKKTLYNCSNSLLHKLLMLLWSCEVPLDGTLQERHIFYISHDSSAEDTIQREDVPRIATRRWWRVKLTYQL